jgi:deoxyhypusine synthase
VSDSKSEWLSGSRIDPEPIRKGIGAADLVDGAFLAYNAGRLQNAARLFVERKLDPDKLPHNVVVYGDSTIVLPLLAAYALTRHEPRPLRRLYDERDRLLDALRRDFVGKASE